MPASEGGPYKFKAGGANPEIRHSRKRQERAGGTPALQIKAGGANPEICHSRKRQERAGGTPLQDESA